MTPFGRSLHVLAPVLGLALAGAAVHADQEIAADPPNATKLTVEGCLTKQGGSDRSTAAEQFVLTVTAPAARDVAATSPPSGGAVPAPPQKTMYVLRSAPEAPRSFNTMIDNHVRITGMTTAPSTTAPLAGRSPEATPYQAPVSAPGQTSGATGTPFDATNLPTLVVHSITPVASKCR